MISIRPPKVDQLEGEFEELVDSEEELVDFAEFTESEEEKEEMKEQVRS